MGYESTLPPTERFNSLQCFGGPYVNSCKSRSKCQLPTTLRPTAVLSRSTLELSSSHTVATLTNKTTESSGPQWLNSLTTTTDSQRPKLHHFSVTTTSTTGSLMLYHPQTNNFNPWTQKLSHKTLTTSSNSSIPRSAHH